MFLEGMVTAAAWRNSHKQLVKHYFLNPLFWIRAPPGKIDGAPLLGLFAAGLFFVV
jgi:hypothetical protein